MAREGYPEPRSIAEAKERKLLLLTDILSIERQLADKYRVDREGHRLSRQEYRLWRGAAHSSLVHKRAEYAYLKEWIIERRRALEAAKIGVENMNDPRSVMTGLHAVLKKALDGDDHALGVAFNVVEQYLYHAA
jgi:hypothetical protein